MPDKLYAYIKAMLSIYISVYWGTQKLQSAISVLAHICERDLPELYIWAKPAVRQTVAVLYVSASFLGFQSRKDNGL